MLFENSTNRIMITTHPIQWRSVVLLIDLFLYPVWKMLSQYWIKKADSLDSACSSPCSTCALPFPVHVEQVCAVARVWEGSVPLALCVWGWQQVALKGQASRPQWSDVCRGTLLSCFHCNWHRHKRWWWCSSSDTCLPVSWVCSQEFHRAWTHNAWLHLQGCCWIYQVNYCCCRKASAL